MARFSLVSDKVKKINKSSKKIDSNKIKVALEKKMQQEPTVEKVAELGSVADLLDLSDVEIPNHLLQLDAEHQGTFEKMVEELHHIRAQSNVLSKRESVVREIILGVMQGKKTFNGKNVTLHIQDVEKKEVDAVGFIKSQDKQTLEELAHQGVVSISVMMLQKFVKDETKYKQFMKKNIIRKIMIEPKTIFDI